MDSSRSKKMLVLDTETTGLNPRRDEVLSLSIVNREGQALLDERFGTVRNRRWDTAQAVHGIAPSDVAGLRPLGAHSAHITQILETAELLVGYNLDFDLAFLTSAGIKIPLSVPRFDVMREFARIHGLRNQRHPHGQWVSLAACARHYGLAFEAHSSLADARATLFCFERICEETGRSL